MNIELIAAIIIGWVALGFGVALIVGDMLNTLNKKGQPPRDEQGRRIAP